MGNTMNDESVGRSAVQKASVLNPPVIPALSEFITGSQSARWPEEVYELARRHVLDTLAVIVACRDLRPSVLARNFALAQSGDTKKNATTILGTRDRAALTDAVFAGAMTGHAAEMNDFCPSAFVQPGPPVVCVALGLAELRRKSGEAVLRSVITGYELACRTPKALGTENLRRLGVSNHAVGAVFGAGAAAASIIGLPEERIADLLSYCAQQASGSWQWLLDIEHMEKAFVFAGMGARNGLQAALLVEAGFTGGADSLDRPGGWMASGMFTEPGSDINRAYLVEDLGTRFELPLVGYKRYPGGGPTQPAIEGLLDLLSKVDRRQVEHVRIELPGLLVDAFRDAAMPALNLPYLSAIILIDGKLDIDAAQSLERMQTDSAVKALMREVEILHDPAQQHKPSEPRAESARVTITLRSGERHTTFVGHVAGFPSHPMSRDDIEQKALELMLPRLGKKRAQALVERVWNIETLKEAGKLAEMMAT